MVSSCPSCKKHAAKAIVVVGMMYMSICLSVFVSMVTDISMRWMCVSIDQDGSPRGWMASCYPMQLMSSHCLPSHSKPPLK